MINLWNAPTPDPSEVKTVAIRLTNWVGDAVMNTPLIAKTRELFPHAEITAMGRPHVAALLKNHPDIDDLWEIKDKDKSEKGKLVERIQKASFDVGIILPNSIGTAMLFWQGKVKHRVGYNRDGRRIFLNQAIPLRPEDLAVHEVRYYLRLLSPWGVKTSDPPQLKLVVTDEEKEKMHDWLRERNWCDNQPVIGVNPAAFYGTAKRWFPERYAAVAKSLAEKYDAKVFVTGLPKEREWAQRVVDEGGEKFHNAAGEMNLRELMAFLSLCRHYLTNDSGAMHIAAALGCPQVAVFGSTDWVTTAPLSPVAKIVREDTPCAPCILRDCPIDHRCMKAVTVDRVIEESCKLWEQTTS